MTAPGRRWFLRPFFLVFAAVILLIAGGVSYLASSSPDGLDSATLQGCTVVHTPAGEELRGQCIAQHEGPHAMAHSPLADYSIGGRTGTGGIAGVVGAVVTVAIAGGGFWLIARSRAKPKPTLGD
jgi:cobalt/nickel transport protein